MEAEMMMGFSFHKDNLTAGLSVTFFDNGIAWYTSLRDVLVEYLGYDKAYSRKTAVSKYIETCEFLDPYVRCAGCGELIKTVNLMEEGSCSCGHHRIRELMGVSSFELSIIKKENPFFASLFLNHEEDSYAN